MDSQALTLKLVDVLIDSAIASEEAGMARAQLFRLLHPVVAEFFNEHDTPGRQDVG
jgi:hypothetical protein